MITQTDNSSLARTIYELHSTDAVTIEYVIVFIIY